MTVCMIVQLKLTDPAAYDRYYQYGPKPKPNGNGAGA